MAAEYTIGIDLGGTNIKAGLVNHAGTLLARLERETQAERGFEHVFARLLSAIDGLLAESDLSKSSVAAIGFGVPGPLSPSRGIIRKAPHLPGWENVPLRARLSEATGLPVVIDNDANAAAFGEFTAGAGRGVRDMVLLTLGTGIGGGIILDGRVWHGHFENAAEIGHMVIEPDGRACPCGQRGCFEGYASAGAVARRFVEALRAGESSTLKERLERGEDVDAKAVARAAEAGDTLARRIWDETCRYLALGCINLQHLLNPARVILGGGMAAAGDQLLTPVREHFARLTWNMASDAPQIKPATLGNDAGIVGSAALARMRHAS